MSAPRYRAAVVGCGRIGVLFELDPHQPRPSSHAGAFAADPRVELAALVDVDPDRLARARAVFPTAAGFTDCVAMLEAVRPAIVAVATPPEAHRAVVELCAERGVRAIVCEKPIALDGDEGRKLVDSCARTGALLFVNHPRRFDPAIRRVRDDVAAGRIGQVQQATAYYTAGILNTGTHLVDLLRFLLGEPAWVMAVGNERTACPRGDADLDALIEFASGARAAVQCLDVRDYSIFDVHVYGRTGSLLLTRFGFETEWTGMKERADVQGYREPDREGRIREGRTRSLMQSVTRHVVECLDGTDTPISRGEDGLAALEMVLALRESAARGGARVAVRHEAT